MTIDMRWMEERIGYERCKRSYAFRSLKDNGALLCFGSDSPGTHYSRYPLNPLYGIHAAVTRHNLPGIPANGWFPEQKLSIKEAIEAYTLNPAIASFEENIKGSIEKNKLADIAILSDNILQERNKTIHNSKVECTILNGNIIFQDHPFSNNK